MANNNPLANWNALKGTAGARVVTGGESAKFENVGDIVAGVVLEHSTVTIEGKERDVTRLRAKDGKTLLLWHAGNLPSLLEDIDPGSRIAVCYTGEKPPKQRGFSPMKLYEVVVFDANADADDDLPF